MELLYCIEVGSIYTNLFLYLFMYISNNIVFLGKITKDRVLKETLLRSQSDPVTGLAFKTSGQYSYLFVATTDSILQYNVTMKNKEFEVRKSSTFENSLCYLIIKRRICLYWIFNLFYH